MKKTFTKLIRRWPHSEVNRTVLLMAGLFLAGSSGAQQSYTFTSAGVSGPTGPTQTQINTAYSSTNLNNSVTVTNGIQTFTVPLAGPYRFTAIGAQGGYNGGYGARVEGTFTLTAGTVLKILVGQQGTQGTNSSNYTAGGGGGGSFITSLTNVPYLVAGGGGGNGDGYSGVPVSCCLNGMEASTVTAGNPHPSGSNGGSGTMGGACPSYGAGAGAGFNGDGSLCYAGTTAKSFTNGGGGGLGFAYGGTVGDGGFGGGGGDADSGVGMRGGGGGGYSGGGGGAANSGNDAAGGGGGSYASGSNTVMAISTTTGNGRVIIEMLCNINIVASGVSNSLAPVICNGNSATLTTNAASNYTWSTGNTSSTSIVVSPNTTTTYSVVGTSSTNCVSSGVITVSVNSGLPVLTITNTPSSICLGKSAVITAGGAVTYSWTGGITNGQTFTPTATQTYTVSGQNGCGISTATTVLTVAPLAVSVLAQPSLVCQGSPSTLTAVSSVSGFTWSPGGSNSNTTTVAPMANSIYTVTASDGTCTGSATLAVNTNPTPTLSATASATMICEGQSSNLSVTGANTYSWSPVGSTSANITVTPSISTLYQVVGYNQFNCSSSAVQVVVVQQSPTISITADKLIVCENTPVTLTASGGNTYNWVGGPGNAVYSPTPSASSVYTVMGTGTTNTCVGTETISIDVISTNLVLSSDTTICAGNGVTLLAGGATSYTWTGGQQGSVFSATPAVTTVYTVSAKTVSQSAVCNSTGSVMVTVNALPTVSVSSSKATICRGNSNTLTATGGVSYEWTPSASGASIVVTPSTSTFYTVIATDANGCQGSAKILAQVNSCLGIADLENNSAGILVYPIPASGVFYIETAGDVDLELVNNIGQHIRNIQVKANEKHQVSDLPSGVYFLKGKAGHHSFSQKIIISK